MKLPENMLMQGVSFGNNNKNIAFKTNNRVPEFETFYIQSRPFSQSSLDPLDDLYATLGDFNIRLLVFGIINFTQFNQYSISINKVGFYIEDKFDYEGFQHLGFWNPANNQVNKVDPGNTKFYQITNGSYREYRDKTSMGGNFRLFSDILYINTNDSFQLDYYQDFLIKKRLLKL